MRRYVIQLTAEFIVDYIPSHCPVTCGRECKYRICLPDKHGGDLSVAMQGICLFVAVFKLFSFEYIVDSHDQLLFLVWKYLLLRIRDLFHYIVMTHTV